MMAGISTKSSTIGSSVAATALPNRELDPLPERAHFLGGLAARCMFADGEAGAQRILMIVAHHDAGLGHDIGGVERGLVAQRIFRAGEARRGPDRGLVQDVGERLVPGPDDAERGGGRLDVGDARPRWNQAEIGVANGGIGRGAFAAGGVDDRHRSAVLRQRFQPPFQLPRGINRLDDRRGIGAAALPVRNGALRVGLDQAGIMSGADGGEYKADGKRAFSRTALLGGQYDRRHFRSSGGAFGGNWGTPYTKPAFCGGEPQLARMHPARPKGEIADARISHLQ